MVLCLDLGKMCVAKRQVDADNRGLFQSRSAYHDRANELGNYNSTYGVAFAVQISTVYS